MKCYFCNDVCKEEKLDHCDNCKIYKLYGNVVELSCDIVGEKYVIHYYHSKNYIRIFPTKMTINIEFKIKSSKELFLFVEKYIKNNVFI